MQKVLSLVWYKIYPPHFGGQKGIALFNKHLAKHFEVDCLCSRDNESWEEAECTVIAKLPTGKIQFLNPVAWWRIKKQLQEKEYGFLIVEFPYYGLAARLLKGSKTKLIIHTHNIESLRFKSLGNRSWRLLKFYEKAQLKAADLVLFKTLEDQQLALQQFSLEREQTYLLPYGIEQSKQIGKAAAKEFLYQRHGIKSSDRVLLFAGTLDYEPNAEAVTALFEIIAPALASILTDFKIIICGRNQSPAFVYLNNYQSNYIINAGFVEDMTSYFSATDVFINPVKNIHGVQTKLFDALCYHLNVVCFDGAARALPSSVNRKVFSVAEGDFNNFVESIVQALSVTFATPEAFFQEFSWESVVQKFACRLKEMSA